MTPSSAGGGELVVTRVREPHADAALTVQPAVRAFRFPTAEALCDACARLRAAGYARESRAYLLCGGEALLTLAAPVPDGIDCRAETDAALLACLTEHGTLLCENAVSLLSPIGE